MDNITIERIWEDSEFFQIEVYMEINDGGSYEKHNCCFYVNTELGLLKKFGESLVNITVPGVGYKVSLA